MAMGARCDGECNFQPKDALVFLRTEVAFNKSVLVSNKIFNFMIMSLTFDATLCKYLMVRLLGCEGDPSNGIIPWFRCPESGSDEKF